MRAGGALLRLFAAGMALVDSLNGLLMLWAYEWTSDNGPMQRLFFSLFLTIASAVVALCIAALQALDINVAGNKIMHDHACDITNNHADFGNCDGNHDNPSARLSLS